MVKRKSNEGSAGASRQKADTSPKFPYTTKPASLRRLLKDIPKKPKPTKFDRALLKSWGFSDANDHSMLRVLKSVRVSAEARARTLQRGLDRTGRAVEYITRRVGRAA